MKDRPIHILAAVEPEAQALSRALAARLASGAVRLFMIGVGARHLPSEAVDRGASCLIVAGVAGGLDPALRCGDVVIDGCPPGFDPQVRYRRGGIYTAREIVSTAAKKAELFRSTGALAVDMEHALVRAAAAGATVIGVRSILDAADEALPRELIELVDSRGRPRPLAVAAHLIRRPSLLPQLLHLSKSTKQATCSLTGAVRDLLDFLDLVPDTHAA